MCGAAPGELRDGPSRFRALFSPHSFLRHGDFCRFGCAMLLVAAAALKSAQLWIEPPLMPNRGGQYFQLMLVETELVVAAWLLSGFWAQWCRRFLLALFSAFACYSLIQGWAGAESCGCLGVLRINPWWTLALDLTSLAAVWLWSPPRVAAHDRPERRFASRAMALAALTLAIVLPLVSVIAPFGPGSAGITQIDSMVVLQPQAWIGKPFPLFELIDIGPQLARGEWHVVIYHNDCPQCRELLSELASRASGPQRAGDQPGIAFIEIPPYDRHASRLASGILQGRLDRKYVWSVRTPVVIRIRDGEVVTVGSKAGSLM